jgi:L-tartrate/succinate antiporter
VVLGLLVAWLPPAEGLGANGWYYFALFVAVIVALITEPLPGPVVGLIGVTLASTLRLVEPTAAGSIRWGLSGFADGTVWLMFVAFVFGLGYQRTGLGRRIALVLVRALGRRTLGLGYAIALTDLALAPSSPRTPPGAGASSSPSSNTSRPCMTPHRATRHAGSART